MGSALKYDITRNQAQLELAEAELSHWQSKVNLLRKQLEAKRAMFRAEQEAVARMAVINPWPGNCRSL